MIVYINFVVIGWPKSTATIGC